MKIRSLVSSLLVLVLVFFSVSEAYAYSRSSRSSSRSSFSSSHSKSYSSRKSTPRRSYSSSTPRKRYSNSSPRKKYSSGINLKKKPVTSSTTKKSSINTKKSSTTTTKKSTVLKKPSYVKKSTVVNININKKPRTSSHNYNGHRTYKYSGHSVYFMSSDFEDCDYDDYLEGDEDCQAYYPDDDWEYAAAPQTSVKAVSQGPSAGLALFRWIMGILFFGILIAALLMIAKRMRKF